MTDTTTEAPERITYNPGYRVTYHGSDPSRGYVYVRDDLHTAAAAAHDEDRARLAVAICGGEDLPGYANSASTEELVRIARRSHSDHMETIDRLLKAQAERDALAAQLASAEARAREGALDALAAYGQAADAHTAQLAAEARLAELEAALTRAWERGRDDAAGVFWTAKDEDDYSYWGGDANAHAVRTNLMGKQRSIRALTPPADLADRVKGGGE